MCFSVWKYRLVFGLLRFATREERTRESTDASRFSTDSLSVLSTNCANHGCFNASLGPGRSETSSQNLIHSKRATYLEIQPLILYSLAFITTISDCSILSVCLF